MHRPPPMPAAVLAAMLLLGLAPLPSAAFTTDPLGHARSLLEQGQAGTAVDVLEEELTNAPPARRAAVLELLRRAYADAAREAEARSRPADAERYRDNLEILGRRIAASDPPAHPRPIAGGLVTAPSPITPATPRMDPASQAAPVATPFVPNIDAEHEPPAAAPIPPLAPAAALPAPAPTPTPAPAPAVFAEVAAADNAFRAKRYDEAGKLYAGLERQGRLPSARRDHWAYCRWTEVVRRLNAKPSTPQEWAEIDAEIQRIRVLSPNNWYGEYLRNRASERSGSTNNANGAGRTARSNRIVIRGSAPEEPPLNIVNTQVQPAPAKPTRAAEWGATPAAAPRPTPRTGPAPEASRPNPVPGGPVQWQVRETPSFRILHDDPELAEQAAEVAEAARESQVKRWVGSGAKGPWTPKCDIYLYPTARLYNQMTGQPEDSPGFSTMGMNGGRIIARRVNLRVDHPNLLRAILPHEITHVVLADLFPNQQIPRWADEGMAVLSEPSSEQHLRAADLEEPLGKGQLFKLEHLMTMDYPEGKFWGLYYAQSVSLTRYLVEQGSPGKFIQFVQRAQTNGPEAELKRIYNIDGYADLHERWLTYARSKSTESTASATRTDPRSPIAPR